MPAFDAVVEPPPQERHTVPSGWRPNGLRQAQDDLANVLKIRKSIWNPLKKRALTISELHRAKAELDKSAQSAASTYSDVFYTGGRSFGQRSNTRTSSMSEIDRGPHPHEGSSSSEAEQNRNYNHIQAGMSQTMQGGFLLQRPNSPSVVGGQSPLGETNMSLTWGATTTSTMSAKEKKKKSLMEHMKEFEKTMAIEAANRGRGAAIRTDKKLLRKFLDFLQRGNLVTEALEDDQKNPPYADPWKLLTLYQLATRHLKKIQIAEWFQRKDIAQFLDFDVEERGVLRKLYLQLCQATKDARFVAQLIQGRRRTGKLTTGFKSLQSDTESSSSPSSRGSSRPTSPRAEGELDSIASDELLEMEPEDFAPPEIRTLDKENRPDEADRVLRHTRNLFKSRMGTEDSPGGILSPFGSNINSLVHFADADATDTLLYNPAVATITETVEKSRRRLYQCLTPRTRKEVRAEEKKDNVDASTLKLFADCAQKCYRLSQQGGRCVSTLQNRHLLDANGGIYVTADADELVKAMEDGEISATEAERVHYEAQMFDLVTRSAAKNAVRRLPRSYPRQQFDEPQLPIEVLVNLCFKFGLCEERFEARRFINEYLEKHNRFLEVFPDIKRTEISGFAEFKERMANLLKARKALSFEDFLNVLCWNSKTNPRFGNDLRGLLKDQYERRQGQLEVRGALIGDRYKLFRDVFDTVPSVANTVENIKTELLIDTIISDMELKQRRRPQTKKIDSRSGTPGTPNTLAAGKSKKSAGGVVAWKTPGKDGGKGGKGKGKNKKDGKSAKKMKDGNKSPKKEAEEPPKQVKTMRPLQPQENVEQKVSLKIFGKLKSWAHKKNVGSSWDDEPEVEEEELEPFEESRKNARFALGRKIRDNMEEISNNADARKLSLRQRWRMEIRDMDIVTMKRDKGADALESIDDIRRHVQQGRFFVG